MKLRDESKPITGTTSSLKPTIAQLRAYINSCHRERCYDTGFELACRELNSRDINPQPNP